MPLPMIDWPKLPAPLINKYKKEKHSLKAEDIFEMVVRLVLSARSNDKLINNIAPAIFGSILFTARG